MKNFNFIYNNPNKLLQDMQDNYLKDNKKLLVQISTTLTNEQDIQNLINEINQVIKEAHIIGFSAYSNIMNGDLQSKTIISFSQFEKTIITPIILEQDFAYELDNKLIGNEKLLFLYSTSRNINIENELDIFKKNHRNKKLTITGGMSSNNELLNDTFVFNNNMILKKGMIGAALTNDNLQINMEVSSQWDKIGKEFVVTKSKDNIVYEIDGKNATEALQAILGDNFPKYLPHAGIEFPLMHTDANFSRTIVNVFPDGSIAFAGNIKENQSFKIGYGNINTLLETDFNIIQGMLNSKLKFESTFVFSCLSRLSFFGKNINTEIELLKYFDDSYGFFTFGELFTDKQFNYHLYNQSMVILQLSEEKILNYNNNYEISKPVIEDAEAFSSQVLKDIIKVSNKETQFYINKVEKNNKKLKKNIREDSLLSINNRYAFINDLQKKIGKKDDFFISIIDINDFKYYNDTYGHFIGDRVLVSISKAIKNKLDKNHTLYRIGGDEFLIISNTKRFSDITDIFKKLFIELDNNYLKLKKLKLKASLSVGITKFNNNFGSEKNIKFADLAMFEAKKQYGNYYVIFHDKLETEYDSKFNMLNKIKKGIIKKEFEVFLQPQYNSISNTIKGAEALVRWKHNGEHIYPNDFISIAEDNHLIYDIDIIILEKSIQQFRHLVDKFNYSGTISINASVQSLNNESYIKNLKYFLKKYEIPTDKIEIELTENLFVGNMEKVISKLNEIKKIGCRIALDDFGTGFSSMSYLYNLPIDKLKIDKSFIDDILNSLKKENVVKGIIGLTEALDIEVIAEGVEKVEEIELLKKNKCFNIQGYIYSKPLSLTDFNILIESENSLD